MYKYAIVGFGGLGKKHLANLNIIEKERGDMRLVAICGTTKEKASESVVTNLGVSNVNYIDFSDCNFYMDYKEMIDTEKPDFILSVLPTYLHKEVAVYALSRGVNVLSEKPMALSINDCEEMLLAAKNNNKVLMIGHVLRFNSAYRKIKEYVDSECFGKVRMARFERYSQTPMWTWNNWILDPLKSGGCILDMHIHDVDIMNWIFGVPNTLYSRTTSNKVPLESVYSTYNYDDFVVESCANWALPQTFPFEARCRIDFEKASVVMQGYTLNVYKDDESFTKVYSDEEDFIEELRTFVKMVIDGQPYDETTSPQTVFDSIKIAVKELESAEENRVISLK